MNFLGGKEPANLLFKRRLKNRMSKILIVDDDEAMRGLLRQRLEDSYEIIDTGNPEEALALALQVKPDCILLDLNMPKLSGFELCQTLSSLNVTRLVPSIVISAYPVAGYKDFCLNLGAKEYLEKPVDFNQLRACIAQVLGKRQVDRRAEIRPQLRVILKLTGTDSTGKAFELLSVTENVSAVGFLCGCHVSLAKGTIVDVFLKGSGIERRVGSARVAHVQWPNTPGQRYGFQFTEKTRDWILR